MAVAKNERAYFCRVSLKPFMLDAGGMGQMLHVNLRCPNHGKH
jgi:hypothetical protein